MRALVTGAAGFIGSTLAERLIARGDDVLGVDCFSDYYDPAAKWRNVQGALVSGSYRLLELDLRTAELDGLLADVDVVFHQAGQPGVRLSWNDGFSTYDTCNVLATQRLLEACCRTGVDRVVYASSSSVYGNAAHYPVTEESLPAPHSPYGVTKLAAEHLCGLYAANYGLSVVSLRYFTVYGPRQRPDMAIHRLVEAALDDRSFPLYGDGSQIRDFTFVDDVVEANLRAGRADVAPGTVVNVCAGGSTSMSDLIAAVGSAVGREVRVDRQVTQPGDVRRTGGDSSKASRLLSWEPAHGLEEGIRRQTEWHRSLRGEAPASVSLRGSSR
ncbi:MAG TPA: NAD-dependent epimerase/dehydratase family protein [Ilumatobacter sp.]|nr:NAD-dependent epimerase/dehydratase family protein [Ilumatobacter sp.]